MEQNPLINQDTNQSQTSIKEGTLPTALPQQTTTESPSSGKAKWIIILGALFILIAAGFIIISMKRRTSSSAKNVSTTYINDLANGNFQDAYNLETTALQKYDSPSHLAQFVSDSNQGINGSQSSKVNWLMTKEIGSSNLPTTTFQYAANGSTSSAGLLVTLDKSGGTWKVSGVIENNKPFQ